MFSYLICLIVTVGCFTCWSVFGIACLVLVAVLLLLFDWLWLVSMLICLGFGYYFEFGVILFILY